MLIALLVSLLSVALGAWLALAHATAKWVEALRWLAILAAGGVALFEMLPEAWAEIGWPSALVALGAGAVPLIFEQLRHAHLRHARGSEAHPGSAGVGLSLGYAGLVVHKVGDGMAMAAFGGVLGAVDPLVLGALALHSIPVTALIVLAFARCAGERAALLRALGLAVASLLGVGVAASIEPAALAPYEPWITAAVAGLLLHIVAHDLHPHGDHGHGVRATEPAPTVAADSSDPA